MRSTRVAEWILAQVTSRERAEAVIGDLLEKVPAHGQLWFWWSVVTTAVALVWRDVAANPMRMLGLAVVALLLQYVLLIPLFVVTWFSFAMIAAVMRRPEFPPPQLTFWTSHPTVAAVIIWCVMALIQFYVGRWLARRSRDHELAPCVAYSIVGLTFNLAWLLSGAQPGVLHTLRTIALTPLFVLWDLPIYAGAVSVRRKQVSA